jgi:hypothetical protein
MKDHRCEQTKKEIAMIRRIAVILLALAFVTVPAWADNSPEFDAVGNDAGNYFNDFIKVSVVNNVADGYGNLINNSSDWIGKVFPYETYSGGLAQSPDTCFDDYDSNLTIASTAGTYHWRIVLQMTPESDLNINIIECVLKDQGKSVWTDAQQTGRYTDPAGLTHFVTYANPKITVKAYPGPQAVDDFPIGGFYLKARSLPGLCPATLDGVRITSKALWEEGLVAALPGFEKGYDSYDGGVARSDFGWGWDDGVKLTAGDMIDVTIEVPSSNTTDIRYGPDNVVVKYIGELFTAYSTLSVQ